MMRLLVWWAGSVTCCAGVASGQEGGIELFAGETIFGRGNRVSISEIYKRDSHRHIGSDHVGNPTKDRWTESRTVIGYDYGLHARFQVSILVPYVRREFRTNGVTSRADGVGDIAALGKYNFYQDNWQQGALNASIIVGAELPTGSTDAETGGIRNVPRAQVGSGSSDAFVGVAANLGSGRSRFDGLLFYKENTEGAQQIEESDFFVGSLQAAYRFYNAEYPGPTVGAGVGLRYEHRGRAQLRGNSLTNSGRDSVLVHVALSIHPIPSVDINASVDVPVYSHYNGNQLARDVIVGLRFGFRF